MQAMERFRGRLAVGETLVGAAITFSDPLVTEALADSVDFVWIDLEHVAMSPGALQGHLLAARGRGVPSLVRVAGSATPFIKPVLDSGAEGIIVPQVQSVAEVRGVVSDCRYPPLGRRGYGPRVPSNYGRDGGSAYVDRANRQTFVAVQIETREALDALDEILAVPGIDSLVLGPWDLSAALGRLGDVEHPEVVAALEQVIDKTRSAGLFVGSGMGPDPAYALTMARRGVQWLQVGCDYGYLTTAMDTIARSIRRGLADDSGARPGDLSS